MLEKDSGRYVAETRLLALLKKHYVHSAQNLSVERPAIVSNPIGLRPWNLWLLLVSLLVACLGVVPYIPFSIRHDTASRPLALVFPFCRVIGGLLCVFPGQLVLQHRIETILKQRILFKGINELSNERSSKIPTQHIRLWDDSIPSEASLSALNEFLIGDAATNQDARPFLRHLSQFLGMSSEPDPTGIAERIKLDLASTRPWWIMLLALLLGFLMTIVGYVGCFTIVQSSSIPSDTYIWLGLEATLAMVRMGIWAWNPAWDDSDGIWLKLTPHKKSPPLPAVEPTATTRLNPLPRFQIVDEGRFWQAVTAHSGPVDIGETKKVNGFHPWYTWVRWDTEGTEGLCIVLEGRNMTVMCLMNENQEFKMNVFRHYFSIAQITERSDCDIIKLSWPLSLTESRVINPVARAVDVHAREKGNTDEEIYWNQLRSVVGGILDGVELEYSQAIICFKISATMMSAYRELYNRLSGWLFLHAQNIYKEAPQRNDSLLQYYNEKWQIYSNGTLYLNHLFEPLNGIVDRARNEGDTDLHPVAHLALTQWRNHVLQKLAKRLLGDAQQDDVPQDDEVESVELERVLGLFMSLDLTKVDFSNMKLQSETDGSAWQAASRLGHVEIVRLLLENGTDVNAKGGRYGNALQAASRWGHMAIVRLLLEEGANVNARGGQYGSALQAAAGFDHIEIVRLLLEVGANVEAGGGQYGRALQAASASGNTEIALVLLEHGADVNPPHGGEYGTALQAASFSGSNDIVLLLLQKGADVNAPGGLYGSALQAASSAGKLDIAKILLQNGANVNAEGGQYGNALQAATVSGNPDTVKVLLEAGADANAETRQGTPLHTACAAGNTKIALLLLEHGADVTPHGGEYGTALQAASFSGSKDIVLLLLQKGADVNAPGGLYGSALQAASSAGKLDIAKILLQRGADVNAEGGQYGNALQAATTSGSPETVQLVLDNGANPNARGGLYGTALEAACVAADTEMARLLIEKGADVNAKGGEYGNALQAASFSGSIDISLVLLEMGANIDAQGGLYGSPLQAASAAGNLDIADILVQNGADVNAEGGQYGNALQAAAFSGKLSTVRLLLDNGADPNVEGGLYGTALEAASAGDHADIVRLLLEGGAQPGGPEWVDWPENQKATAQSSAGGNASLCTSIL
ncbi:ankyrin repeat-containing domain protein [Mycena polygramma]|nr:ankyrin repeat-containing domain protein [Mycena polygramma]